MAAELQAANILHGPAAQCGEGDGAIVAALKGAGEGVDGGRVDPIVTEVIEVRVEVFEVDTRGVIKAIVKGSTDALAIAKVLVVAKVVGAGEGGSGLDVVDAAAVVVI